MFQAYPQKNYSGRNNMKTYEIIIVSADGTTKSTGWSFRYWWEPMSCLIGRALKMAEGKNMIIDAIRRID